MKYKEMFRKIRMRHILLSLLLLFILLSYLRYVFLLLFVAIASFSKIYHRYFHSTLGIDLVLFVAIISSLAVSPLIGFIVGIISLGAADYLGNRLSYTSVVTALGIAGVAFLASFAMALPFTMAAIALLIAFELIVSTLYLLMGSPVHRLITFLASHVTFNIFLILSFGLKVKGLIS